MRIVGILCWWDESPSWLATAVAGFARVCDDIVAVDGAYSLMPGGRARSRPDQAEAILAAAEAGDAGCVIHRPRDVFFGQEVEKRNLALALAAPLEPDWLVVFDADMHVMQAAPETVRRDLAETDCDVATYTILDGADMLADPARADLAARVVLDTEWTNKFRAIYRWLPGLAYGPAHFSVSGLRDRRVWLRGANADEIAPAHDLGRALVVHHRRAHRALVRNQAADGYAQARQRAGHEAVDDIHQLVT